MSFQVTYVGNHGVNLQREEGINYFDPALGARPNPNFGNITLQTDSGLQLLQRSAALLHSPCGQGWFELPGKLHLRPRD